MILVSLTFLVISSWLFYTAKSKRKKVEFVYKESNENWVVFKTNYWTALKAYTTENATNLIIALIFVSVLVVLGAYYFYGESALGITVAVILAVWGAIGASLFLGSNSSDTEVSSGTEKFFKIVRETIENIKENFIKDKDESVVY